MSVEIERMATELVAKWEHGSEEHRQWLRDVAVPDVVAFAARVRALAIEEVLRAQPSFLSSAVRRMAVDFSGRDGKP